MAIWSAEIKELEKLYESLKGHFPELEKELEQLIGTKDANVILLYSRRCLEVMVTDLCECELKRPRKTEPLKGIIDKLYKEEKVPSHIISSMHGLNELSTYGTHPKDFDPEQVKPVLNNLDIIIKWYLKYKETDSDIKVKPTEEIKHEIKSTDNEKKDITISRKRLAGILGGLIGIIASVVAVLYFTNIIEDRNQTKVLDKSIAVLPFRNLSNDTTQLYFSDGIVEAILDHLFKVGELKVISSTSTKRYRDTELPIKEIARELGVASILEGSVQRIGNNVRITTQLIEAKTDVHLWSETYDKDISDIFAIQSEVAQNVARALKATLTSEEAGLIEKVVPTSNQIAYDYYLKGDDYSSKLEINYAIEMYTEALKEDPLFAAAYAKRAIEYMRLFWYKFEGWHGNDLRARKDIKQGLELNPDLPDLKLAQAYYFYFVNRDYDKALKVIDELKAETPSKAALLRLSAYILRRQGKYEESISELKLALQLDPFNAVDIDGLAVTYQLLRQYDNSFKTAKEGFSLIPGFKGRQGLSLPIEYKGFKSQIFDACLFKAGDLQVALKESGLNEEDVQYKMYYYSRQYNKLLDFVRKDSIIQSDQFTFQPKTFRLALIYYLSGNLSLCKIYADSAIFDLKGKLKEDPDDDRVYATLGKCYAFVGEAKEAVTCGEKAVDLKPIKSDALQGIAKEQDLMEIYIFTGNYNLALERMDHLLSIPSLLHVGEILLNPIYDNLRSIPRFQKIINSASNN